MALFGCACLGAAQAEQSERPAYATDVRPLLEQFCYDCHGNGADEGGMQLDAAETNDTSVDALVAEKKLWGKVWENVLTENMPPPDMPQPTAQERQMLSRWIGQTVFQLDPAAPDPGRVTIRRLNRVEYRYSILDLFDVDFNVVEHFPADDTGYGFDTIGDVLTVPPTLMEKYFLAAAEISERLLREARKPAEKRGEKYRRVFGEGIPDSDPAAQLTRVREIVQWNATRAYRQPVDDATVENLVGLSQPAFEAGEVSAEELVCRAIEAMLVSPRFLYRAEFQPRPQDPASVHRIDEFALAARLSYFLWSSLPDVQLFELAKAGRLREQLRPQVERMVQDPKSRRFVKNFVGQWLQTRDVRGIHRSRKFDGKVNHVRTDMMDETYEFFQFIMREDRDVIELISADYTFLTEDLAKFYGVPDVHGSDPQYVELPADSPRGGILTHGSVLMVTSNPDRTSPVKRGLFLLDNVLGTPSPPAPPDVPPLEESRHPGEKYLTMREQLARHRADSACAVCHDRMDPLGLGLENFDAIGRWRTEDAGHPIDSSSQLATGEPFSDVRELKKILTGKRRLFYRCLVRKLMTYALGRGIEYTDTVTVESIVDSMMAEGADKADGRAGGKFSTLLMGIVESPPFQMRRGHASSEESVQ